MSEKPRTTTWEVVCLKCKKRQFIGLGLDASVEAARAVLEPFEQEIIEIDEKYLVEVRRCGSMTFSLSVLLRFLLAHNKHPVEVRVYTQPEEAGKEEEEFPQTKKEGKIKIEVPPFSAFLPKK